MSGICMGKPPRSKVVQPPAGVYWLERDKWKRGTVKMFHPARAFCASVSARYSENVSSFYADTVTNYISWSMILQVVLLADQRGRLMNLVSIHTDTDIPPARIRATTVDGSGSGLSVSISLLPVYFLHATSLHTRMHRFVPKHLQITKSELLYRWA